MSHVPMERLLLTANVSVLQALLKIVMGSASHRSAPRVLRPVRNELICQVAERLLTSSFLTIRQMLQFHRGKWFPSGIQRPQLRNTRKKRVSNAREIPVMQR